MNIKFITVIILFINLLIPDQSELIRYEDFDESSQSKLIKEIVNQICNVE